MCQHGTDIAHTEAKDKLTEVFNHGGDIAADFATTQIVNGWNGSLVLQDLNDAIMISMM